MWEFCQHPDRRRLHSRPGVSLAEPALTTSRTKPSLGRTLSRSAYDWPPSASTMLTLNVKSLRAIRGLCDCPKATLPTHEIVTDVSHKLSVFSLLVLEMSFAVELTIRRIDGTSKCYSLVPTVCCISKQIHCYFTEVRMSLTDRNLGPDF